ncbi:MAG: arginine--tRNA ligase [Patescibacteria group bacterium]|nr:arginine--tRNA ligase [Patescibacteria group bacterium]
METFKNKIAESLAKKTNIDFNILSEVIEVPTNEEFGDFSFPCFQLSKILKIAPTIVAKSIAEDLEIKGIEKIEAIGPYINFFIDKKNLANVVIKNILKKGDKYGSSLVGIGKTVVIDFSSVNIAKPFHIGHLKSTAIGNSLYKIYSFLGYQCVGVNHVGDWGTQFGKLIVAFKKWGDDKKKYSVKDLVSLYVKFHKEAEKDEGLNEEARGVFKKLEANEIEYVSLWRMFRELSLKEFKRVYKLLNIKFDSWNGESFYNDKVGDVVAMLEEKKMLEKSRGAYIVDLEKFNMPPCIVKRSDGASLYATRDLAAIFYRKKEYNFYKTLYVVGNAQQLHFKQIFKVVELMGFGWADDLIHVDFGTVSLQEGAMSTRKGIVVYLEDVLNESIIKVNEILKNKGLTSTEQNSLAKKIGIGAVIFSALFVGRQSDSTFLWEKVLNFEGDSSPYAQYTYVRIRSLIKKVNKNINNNINYSLLCHENELSLLKLLSEFPNVITEAASRYEPSVVARYVIELAKYFNKFYHNCPVINLENEDLQNARVSLCVATSIVIKSGLNLLGVDCPEKM